jgi:hypothetical protein
MRALNDKKKSSVGVCAGICGIGKNSCPNIGLSTRWLKLPDQRSFLKLHLWLLKEISETKLGEVP